MAAARRRSCRVWRGLNRWSTTIPRSSPSAYHRPCESFQERHAAGHDRSGAHGEGGLHASDSVERPFEADADLGRRHRRCAPCGCRVAAKTYCTPTLKDADIVVANGYPQNAQAFHGGLWINHSVRDGGTGVLVVQHPLGLDPVHYLNNRLAGLSGATQFDLTSRAPERHERQWCADDSCEEGQHDRLLAVSDP